MGPYPCFNSQFSRSNSVVSITAIFKQFRCLRFSGILQVNLNCFVWIRKAMVQLLGLIYREYISLIQQGYITHLRCYFLFAVQEQIASVGKRDLGFSIRVTFVFLRQEFPPQEFQNKVGASKIRTQNHNNSAIFKLSFVILFRLMRIILKERSEGARKKVCEKSNHVVKRRFKLFT